MPSVYSAPLLTAPKQFLNKHYIKNLACGRWKQVLQHFGIDATFLINKHGSCPVCGGKDRFRFDDKNGDGTFICNRCGAGDGFKLLQLHLNCSFIQVLRKVAIIIGANSDDGCSPEPRHIRTIMSNAITTQSCGVVKNPEKQRELLNAIWKQSLAIRLTDPVDAYLKARGIDLSQFPSSLRFHPNLGYYEEEKLIRKFPAMIAIVKDEGNRGVSIHRTYLSDGCKANVKYPKKLMSPIYQGAISGAAIKLFEPIEGELAVAEGVENALAFHISTGIPTWAAISAAGLQNVKLPNSVTNVTIAADNDESGVGQRAAEKLRRRLIAEGRHVKCIIPPQAGNDFADMLKEAK